MTRRQRTQRSGELGARSRTEPSISGRARSALPVRLPTDRSFDSARKIIVHGNLTLGSQVRCPRTMITRRSGVRAQAITILRCPGTNVITPRYPLTMITPRPGAAFRFGSYHDARRRGEAAAGYWLEPAKAVGRRPRPVGAAALHRPQRNRQAQSQPYATGSPVRASRWAASPGLTVEQRASPSNGLADLGSCFTVLGRGLDLISRPAAEVAECQ